MLYPYAVWRPNIVQNYGAGRIVPIGCLCHFTASCADSSTFGWVAQGSHFLVRSDGGVEQFADTSDLVWHAIQASFYYFGIEHAANPPNPYSSSPYCDLTIPQLSASAALCAWLSLMFGIPVRRSLGGSFAPGFKSHFDGRDPSTNWNYGYPYGRHWDGIWKPDIPASWLDNSELAALNRSPWTWEQFGWVVNSYRDWWVEQGVYPRASTAYWYGPQSGGG
jgi:hypothetical protein